MTFEGGNVAVRLNGRHHTMQVFQVPYFDINKEAIKVRFPVHKVQVRDICTLLANQCADSPQDTLIVAYRDVQRHRVDWGMNAAMPVQIDPTPHFVFELGQGAAIYGVNDDTSPLVSYSNDTLSWHWLAAKCSLERLVGRQSDNGQSGIDDITLLPRKIWIEYVEHIPGRDLGPSKFRQ